MLWLLVLLLALIAIGFGSSPLALPSVWTDATQCREGRLALLLHAVFTGAACGAGAVCFASVVGGK